MAIRKYIQQVHTASTGHEYQLVAVTRADICTGKLLNQINPTLHRFKDHEAVMAGMSPSGDRIQPISLFKADMEIGLSPLEIMNAITQAIADKGGFEIVEFEEDINEKSLEEYNQEKQPAEPVEPTEPVTEEPVTESNGEPVTDAGVDFAEEPKEEPTVVNPPE